MNRTLKSARSRGAVGPRAIVPRLVVKLNLPGPILDFGAGPEAIHTKWLREQGYKVVAYELPQNCRYRIHDPQALRHYYNTVMASNVLNVQNGSPQLHQTLINLSQATRHCGVMICNYPVSPRYLPGLTPCNLLGLLNRYYNIVERLPVSVAGHNTVFLCRSPKY